MDKLKRSRIAALETLDTYWNSTFPVDPAKIAMSHGIKVFRSDLDSNVAGIVLKRDGRDAEIHLNKEDSPHRQNFTCARGLGFFIERSSFRHDRYSFVFVRKPDEGDRYELFTRAFAMELLLPESEVIREWREQKNASLLASKFAVSLPAFHSRLNYLGIA